MLLEDFSSHPPESEPDAGYAARSLRKEKTPEILPIHIFETDSSLLPINLPDDGGIDSRLEHEVHALLLNYNGENQYVNMNCIDGLKPHQQPQYFSLFVLISSGEIFQISISNPSVISSILDSNGRKKSVDERATHLTVTIDLAIGVPLDPAFCLKKSCSASQGLHLRLVSRF